MIRLTYIKGLAFVWSALICLLAAACSSDKQGEPDVASMMGEIDIELEISVPGSRFSDPDFITRATLADDYEPSSNNYEDLDHLRVIIVEDATGIITHNRGIRFRNGIPVADNMRFKVASSTDYTIYLLGNCENLQNFSDNNQNDSSDDEQGDVPANAPDFGPDVLPVGSIYPAGLIEDTKLVCPRMNTDGPLLLNNFGVTKNFVPITEKYNITTEAYTGALGQTQLVNLFITRAVSKFVFSVKTSDDYKGIGSPRLTTIGISGLADKEYLLPRNATYNPPIGSPSTNKYQGREITDFTTPTGLTLSEYRFDIPTTLDLQPGMTLWKWAPELYFAESPLTDDGIGCSLSFDNGKTWLLPIKLPNLPYGLPRNTACKVDITIGNNNALLLELTVLPWDQITSEFDYANEVNIASDGSLTFVTGTYKSLDKTTARLVLNDYPEAATGTFGLATPVGMRWDAYLFTEEGETDAIQFKLADGSTSTRISGIVGSENKAEFNIVAVNPPGSRANTAVLQVVVTTADGRGIPANILFGGGYGTGVRNLTVIQNPQ